MNNAVVLPIVIPILSGVVFILLRSQIRLQRVMSIVSTLATAVSSLWLGYVVYENGIQVLELGGWSAPFGIVLVADMFAVMLVAVSAIVMTGCIGYAFRSIEDGREAYFFYPLMQFLLAGVNGSFLTGDIFNLFVFFEVMLISSYVLIVLGGTKPQLRESIKYLLVNIVSSTLFVVAVAFLYKLTGALNMAHLSQRVADAGQSGPLTVVAVLFLIVFALKAALFLYFWLPGAYSAPPTAVVAIFAALLSKVGIYAMFRIFTLIFYHEPGITHQWIAWMSALTMILGVIGALAYTNIKTILIYNIIGGVGFIVFGLASATYASYSGAIYYLIHDMVTKALLFLAGGAIIKMAGTSSILQSGGWIRKQPLLGSVFLLTAIALAGIPPLSGFPGKLLILQGGFENGDYILAGIALLTSFLLLYSLLRLFMRVFWGEPHDQGSEHQESETMNPLKGLIAPCVGLLALSIAIGFGAEWIQPYVERATETLGNPQIYIQAVLKE